MIKHALLSLVIACAAAAPVAALAEDAHVAPVRKFIASKIQPWLTDPIVIEAIKEQNAKHAYLSQADIEKLDLAWRAQVTTANRPLVDEVLGREISKFLAQKQELSRGMISELFVMDSKGLNVGQSEVTSDYWQGDEAKWRQTYSAGPDVIYFDRAAIDESSQALQLQASLTISDPQTGEAIGAITIGINLDLL
ncbi:hypothetical protein [Hoeflea sp.]|uniref:hypothetical protein n=1 Tax=Hoeflea sp. TaxID=1940281 RepID=UPI0025C6A2C9|nr:hypothetical protein [Hoeflea sp.]